MQLYASKYIHFLYIITFFDSLWEGLQGFPTLKQIVSLNIGLKHIISDYNQGHITRELRTRGWWGVNHLVFQPCSWEILLFLSYHLMYKCGTTLALRNNCFIQSLVKDKAFNLGSLLVWFFYYSSWFEGNNTQHKACYYVVFSGVERDESPNCTKQLENVQDLTYKLECQFCHGWWTLNWEWKKTTNKLASLNFSSNLGREEMLIESCVQLAREKIVDAKYNVIELVEWHGKKEIHLGLYLNEEPLKGIDVDDEPTPIIKLPQAYEYAQ